MMPHFKQDIAHYKLQSVKGCTKFDKTKRCTHMHVFTHTHAHTLTHIHSSENETKMKDYTTGGYEEQTN
jgi:hypothetical protein